MIEAYLSSGHDVVLPQMVLDLAELARFEAGARRADSAFVERFLMDDVDNSVDRFYRRGGTDPDDAWHRQVGVVVAADGGRESLMRSHAALERIIESRPDAQVIDSVDGSPDATYQHLILSLT